MRECVWAGEEKGIPEGTDGVDHLHGRVHLLHWPWGVGGCVTWWTDQDSWSHADPEQEHWRGGFGSCPSPLFGILCSRRQNASAPPPLPPHTHLCHDTQVKHRSDEEGVDDELLSVAVLKGGKKVCRSGRAHARRWGLGPTASRAHVPKGHWALLEILSHLPFRPHTRAFACLGSVPPPSASRHPLVCQIVCGTTTGVLNVWSWGSWNDCSDRFPGG